MDVVHAPDQRLKVKTKPIKKITPAVLNTLRQMIKLTQSFKDPEGVGLAATQVGLTDRFFVARLHDSKEIPPAEPGQRKKRWANYKKEFVEVVNPQILTYSKATKTYFEGCLSVPTIWGQVKRHTWLEVEYLDKDGNIIRKKLTGIPAWIFQHEVDHLDGILFMERVLQQGGKFYKFTGKDKTGTDIFEEITLE